MLSKRRIRLTSIEHIIIESPTSIDCKGVESEIIPPLKRRDRFFDEINNEACR